MKRGLETQPRNMNSKIELEFEGLDINQTEHIREIINVMFESGAFYIRNGKVVLHFDHEGTLQEVGVDHKRWKRRKS